VDDIAETAMTFVRQAARYSDRELFKVSEAFAILFDTIDLFNGTHFQSARKRRHLCEAVNIALSSIPGNQVSVRSCELTDGTFVIEWLPYIKTRTPNVSRHRSN
jgi:hypothetical protein